MSDRVTQLAFEIADGAAMCDIEILCAPVGGEPLSLEAMRTCWFDLNRTRDPDDLRAVKTSAEYLDRRGLLRRHPVHANWVRPRHPAPLPLPSDEIEA
ncbi:MAG TPA: hypothetical protein VEC01_09165 [Noviherbaspirillum sp.]|uniref:hypothetical protein n=1 Tax=Noviherbaspirillum sp. TaxID=1926288 RepID=UPI002D321D18|nr:hypothetical protein [Noviherbaspirillum sp.]HYD95483.1 hypothetical protein [Noviherbaspirillum sp.]